jgi:polyhydroxyalkanoate synthesis regulator phasin
MSSRQRLIEKDSFSRCDETCPDVDRKASIAKDEISSAVISLVDNLVDQIKSIGTGKLRDALTACCEELHEMTNERDTLQERVDELERLVEDLKTELNEVTQ